MGKPEGERPRRRPRRTWVDNTELDLGEIGWGGMDWTGHGQVKSSCEFDNEPSGSIKCWNRSSG
jgi:hypothetical protein